MGIATPTCHHPLQLPHHISHHQPPGGATTRQPNSDTPVAMSHHGFHHGFLGFPQSVDDDNTQDRQRVQATMAPPGAPIITGGGPDPSVYDPSAATSILSEMFNFAGTGPSATELLASQMSGGWYAPAQAATDPAAAMQLFLMNPPPPAHVQGPRGFAGPGQGLSLSLNSSLQQLEVAKPEDLFYGQQLPAEGSQLGQSQPLHVASYLRQSKYAHAAQELLEEFCSVGRGQLKRARRSSNPNPNPSTAHAGGSGGASSSSSKEPVAPPLSAADRFEHQRKKSKLSSMLDEVDRRYNHYCDQMQMVVNSFDSVMGFGAATPYTALARKAMSRHFRCLKDEIIAQLKQTCEVLGEKESAAATGITKGETPRLRLLDQSLRQQRAFNQMGMMEQEAWRPQRGLPERSVNILRSWLFEHFLHPYPNDADKHMLARQTGLSRNQVTNWFINARVRLWKPMVEEMYQQESKDEDDTDIGEGSNRGGMQSPRQEQYHQAERLEINVAENEPSSSSLGRRTQLQHQQQYQHHSFPSLSSDNHLQPSSDDRGDFLSAITGAELPTEFLGMDGNFLANYGARMIRPGEQVQYGTSGDVSLTLGLRHASNAPENNRFSLRDFGDDRGDL